jgi:hypothetical protein
MDGLHVVRQGGHLVGHDLRDARNPFAGVGSTASRKSGASRKVLVRRQTRILSVSTSQSD